MQRHASASRGLATNVARSQRSVNNFRTAREQRGRVRPQAATGDDRQPSQRQTPKQPTNSITIVKELRENISWNQATVTLNESVSLDGNTRLLHLSVSDHVDLLYGRKVKGVEDSKRWRDNYMVPGQFVGLRLPGGSEGEKKVVKQLFNLASSPYDSQKESAYLDASIIQIVADRNGCEDNKVLAGMGPGSLLEVTQVVGRGFTSLFNTVDNLLAVLEAGKPLLVIALGQRGIVVTRALLDWTPIQAHATKHNVTCIYMTKSAATAAFLPSWDLWREAGVDFIPAYTEVYSPENNEEEATELLEKILFLREGGFSGLVGNPSELHVLLAGASGEMVSQLSKRLTAKGVPMEHMLFCDFF